MQPDLCYQPVQARTARIYAQRVRARPASRLVRSRSASQEVVINSFHTIGRLGIILAGLTGALAAFSAGAVPAALARAAAPPRGDPSGYPELASPRPEPPGWNKHPPLPAPAHTMVTGGMPGWQIALIAAGAALLVAALAVIVYRARAARRRATVSAA